MVTYGLVLTLPFVPLRYESNASGTSRPEKHSGETSELHMVTWRHLEITYQKTTGTLWSILKNVYADRVYSHDSISICPSPITLTIRADLTFFRANSWSSKVSQPSDMAFGAFQSLLGPPVRN